jgi:hypothetical protein
MQPSVILVNKPIFSDGCTHKFDECSGKKFDDSPVKHSKEDAVSASNIFHPVLVSTRSEEGCASALDLMNEKEHLVLNKWNERDEENSLSLLLQERLSLVDDGRSINVDERNRNRNDKRRADAQTELLAHSNKAMAVYGGEARSLGDIANTTVKAMPKPANSDDTDAMPLSPYAKRKLTPALSFEQRAMLGRFATILKNDGVEVLKLGRNNNWQHRWLTVSKEVMWISAQDIDGDISQAPKALLWIKSFVTRDYGLSNIRSGGRGGFHFLEMRKLEATPFGAESRAPIPQQFRQKFPAYVGMNIEYTYGCDKTRSLSLCFKSKADAIAFQQAMSIIREVITREPRGDSRLKEE